jgi:hypothetical protein
VKWKTRGNQNIQMITTEDHKDQPIISVITCDKMRIGGDAMEKGKGMEQWKMKVVDPMPTFNPNKEK